MLRDLRARVVLAHVDGDTAADRRIRRCRDPRRERLDAADVLRVEVHNAGIGERQLAAAQRRRRIIVQYVDGGGKPCRNACAARGDADLPRDVDEQGLGERVHSQLLCLDVAVLNERRGLVLRLDDGGGAGGGEAAAACSADRDVDDARVGDTLDIESVCAPDVEVAALDLRFKVIFNQTDADAQPRRRRGAVAHSRGDACRRRDDGAAAVMRQIAVLIDCQGAFAVALCKILLILVARGLDAARLEVVRVVARRLFVVRADAGAVCRQGDVREVRARLVLEVVDGKAARHRLRTR